MMTRLSRKTPPRPSPSWTRRRQGARRRVWSRRGARRSRCSRRAPANGGRGGGRPRTPSESPRSWRRLSASRWNRCARATEREPAAARRRRREPTGRSLSADGGAGAGGDERKKEGGRFRLGVARGGGARRGGGGARGGRMAGLGARRGPRARERAGPETRGSLPAGRGPRRRRGGVETEALFALFALARRDDAARRRLFF